MSKPDKDEKEPLFGTHWGDLGTIVIAFLLTLVGVGMFFASFSLGPAPKKPAEIQQKPETDMLLFAPTKK